MKHCRPSHRRRVARPLRVLTGIFPIVVGDSAQSARGAWPVSSERGGRLWVLGLEQRLIVAAIKDALAADSLAIHCADVKAGADA